MGVRFLSIITLFFAFGLLSAVAQPRRVGGLPSGRGSEEGDQDSRKKKSNTPKDTIVFKMKVYQFRKEFSQLAETKLDTAFDDFQTYHPVLKKTISFQGLGNYGTSVQSNDFFERTADTHDFLFLKNYKYYGVWPRDIRFYNTTKPFTLLEYGQWFSNKPYGESWVRVFQTQNINAHLNFGFTYGSNSSTGKYLNQGAKDNDLNLFASYTLDRYDLWFIVGKNKFSVKENGGLLYPTDIENPDLKPENLPVWLSGTGADSKNTFAVLAHQYKFGKWVKVRNKKEEFQQFIPRFSVMHSLEYSGNSRYFHEVDPNPYYDFTDSRGTQYFYGTQHPPYINGAKGSDTSPGTQDNSGMNRLTNMFYLKSIEAPDRKYTFGKEAYIGNDMIQHYYPRQELIYTPGLMMPPIGMTQSANQSNTFVGASLFRSAGKFWNWNATGRYYVQGYRFGDFDLQGSIDKPIRTAHDTSFVRIFGGMSNVTPEYFYNHFYSNHFQWQNNFDKTYQLKAGMTYDNPHHHFSLGARYTIINKFIYWNENGLPDQASSEFSVAQLFVRKDFRFGPLNIQNSVQYQKSTTDKYVHIPELSTRNTLFLQGILSKVLHFQLGADVRFDTKYFADYYNPALGMFYVQQKEQIGEFPWVDIFLNLKLKRTRFYIKSTNMGAKFLRQGYYTTPGYAAQVAALSFGLSWTFYN